MKPVSAIPRHAAWLLIGRLAGQLLAVVMTVILAARMGLVGFGEYAFVTAVIFLANVATTFGTDMVLIRDVAGHRPMARWAPALMVQFALSSIVIGLIWMAAPLLPERRNDVADALRILSLTLVPSAMFSVATAVLRGAGMIGSYAAVGVAAAALPLGAVAALVRPGTTVAGTAAVLLLAQVATGLLSWTVCAIRLPEFRTVPTASAAEVGDMARASASIGVLGILGVLYQRVAAIAIALVAGPAATGWFAGATRIVEASRSGHVALFGAVYPVMAAQSGETAASRNDDLAWSWRMCLGFGGLVSLGLLVLGPLLVDRLYGPAFGPSRSALAILALTVVPSTVATYRSLQLLGEHRERETLRALAASTVVLLAASAVLMPLVGWIGACWAVLIADISQAVLMCAAGSAATASRRLFARDRAPSSAPSPYGGEPG